MKIVEETAKGRELPRAHYPTPTPRSFPLRVCVERVGGPQDFVRVRVPLGSFSILDFEG